MSSRYWPTCGEMGSLKRWSQWSRKGTTTARANPFAIPSSLCTGEPGAHRACTIPMWGWGLRSIKEAPQRTRKGEKVEPLLQMMVNDRPLQALVDTGATFSTVTRGIVDKSQ